MDSLCSLHFLLELLPVIRRHLRIPIRDSLALLLETFKKGLHLLAHRTSLILKHLLQRVLDMYALLVTLAHKRDLAVFLLDYFLHFSISTCLLLLH